MTKITTKSFVGNKRQKDSVLTTESKTYLGLKVQESSVTPKQQFGKMAMTLIKRYRKR